MHYDDVEIDFDDIINRCARLHLQGEWNLRVFSGFVTNSETQLSQ